MNKKLGRPPGQFKGKYPVSIGGKTVRMFRKWQSMIARTTKPSHQAYEHYRSKGITVCVRWSGKDGYHNFRDDMGDCPDGLTLERIDNNGHYEPSNCRWATWKEQAANRAKGGPLDPASLRQRAIKAGLPYHVVYQRVKLHRWTEDRALSTPVQPRGRPSLVSRI